MKKYFLSATGFFLLVVASIAQASDQFDFLLRDAEYLEEELQQIEQDIQLLESDLRFEEGTDIFPEENSAEEAAAAERVRGDDVSTTHVYIRVNGVPIILEDVSLLEWFAVYVRDMAERGIITGYKDIDGNPLGRFGPSDNITVEQLAKIAVEASLINKSKCPEEPKNELAKDQWSAIYISCAEYFGWSVYKEADVDISLPATRLQVLTTILDAFGRDLELGTGETFKDVKPSMPSRHVIETAAGDGIVSGYSDENGDTGYFGPFDKITRAATAKIVSLAIQVYGAH